MLTRMTGGILSFPSKNIRKDPLLLCWQKNRYPTPVDWCLTYGETKGLIIRQLQCIESHVTHHRPLEFREFQWSKKVPKVRFRDAFEVWIYFVDDVQNLELLIIFHMCIACQTSHGVLASSGCYNEIPQSVLFKRQTLTSHRSGVWKSKTKVLANLISDEDPIPGLQPSHCVLTLERERQLWFLFFLWRHESHHGGSSLMISSQSITSPKPHL